MRSFCQAAISASDQAIRPGDTRIGLGKSPFSIMDRSVDRDLMPAAARTNGSLMSRSSDWTAIALVSCFEAGILALRGLNNEGRGDTIHDDAIGKNDIEMHPRFYPRLGKPKTRRG